MRSQLCAVPAALAQSGETLGACEEQPGTGQGAAAQVGHLGTGPEARGAPSRTRRVPQALWEQPAAGEALLCEYRK